MSNAVNEQIHQKLQAAKRILVVSHIRPDGDAVGSLLGLGLALQSAGKDVQMVSAEGVPASFRHLPGSQEVRNHPEGTFDLIVVLDCGEMKRIGYVLDGSTPPDINIDHHITNQYYAEVNLVDTIAVATAEILAENLAFWGFQLSQPVATALMNGLITDTLGFRTSNMTSKAMRVAADLMERGVDMPELYAKALVHRSFEAVRFWGFGLTHLEREGPIVWATLTQADRKAAGYPGRDDADMVNLLSTINDAAITLIFVEQPEDKVKISWRAQPGFDVSQVALHFGGGGHPAAAGAEITGHLEEVRSSVLSATRKLLKNNQHVIDHKPNMKDGI
ncbi:MAG TPA: hypothetical protein ENI27_08190 [bacterium]|nr:hypothetical protein [bacterium]